MSGVINFDKDGKCLKCDWRPEYPDSHVEYSCSPFNDKLSCCEYIRNKYVLILDDENGEIDYIEKPKCRVCDVLLPLKKNHQINRHICMGGFGDYYHKTCFNKEKIIMHK